MEWFEAHEALAFCIVGLSAALTVGGLLAAPLAVMYMPADYFLDSRTSGKSFRSQHPAIRWTLIILKNTLGAVLVIAGIVLALPGVPGPGIVVFLVGLSLLDLPGKRKLERAIVGHHAVLKKINALRAKAKRPPLQLPST